MFQSLSHKCNACFCFKVVSFIILLVVPHNASKLAVISAVKMHFKDILIIIVDVKSKKQIFALNWKDL